MWYVDGLAMKIIEKAYMRTPTLIPPNQTHLPQKNLKESDSVSNPSEVCTAQHKSQIIHMHAYMYKPYNSLKP